MCYRFIKRRMDRKVGEFMKKYHVFKINIKILNIVNLIILLILTLFTYILFPNNIKEIIALYDDIKIGFLLLPLIIIYFSLHELFHALGYIIHGANPKKITFGAELEKSVLYCLCKDEISKKNILFSLMYPLFFLGIVTYVISIIFNYPVLLLLSIANIGGAAGDIMYFLFFIQLDKDILFSEMDDGTSFALISKENPNKYKHIGLDYVGVVDEIPRNDFKMVKISRLSAIFFVICLLCLLGYLII